MSRKQNRWNELYDAVATDISQWRQQNRKATFSEIESNVDSRLATVRAQMLADLVVESDVADMRQVSQAERPACPECNTQVHSNGQQQKRLRTEHEQEVRFERSQAKCPRCGHTFFPTG